MIVNFIKRHQAGFLCYSMTGFLANSLCIFSNLDYGSSCFGSQSFSLNLHFLFHLRVICLLRYITCVIDLAIYPTCSKLDLHFYEEF